MRCYISPGGGGQNATERETNSCICRTTRNRVLHLSFKGPYRTLKFLAEIEGLRLLLTSIRKNPNVVGAEVPYSFRSCHGLALSVSNGVVRQAKKYCNKPRDSHTRFVNINYPIWEGGDQDSQFLPYDNICYVTYKIHIPPHLSGKIFLTAFQFRGLNAACISSLASHRKSSNSNLLSLRFACPAKILAFIKKNFSPRSADPLFSLMML